MADSIIRSFRPQYAIGPRAAMNALPYGDIEAPRYVAGNRQPMGMEEPGNINIMDRPSVWNPNGGGQSSVYSMTFEVDGKHVVVPTVTDDGKIETPDEAVQRYDKTGRHLGKFSTGEMADAYAEQLHLQQEKMFNDARAAAALQAFGQR